MRQINTSDKRFHDGNGRNEMGTIVTAEWLNAVQDELVNLVTTLGGRVDSNTPNQIATLLLAKLNQKIGADSPALTGTPTAPTANQSVNNTQLATTAFVHTAINGLIGSAPETLNTLNELAAALNNNADFAANMVAAMANKVDKTVFNTLIGVPLPYPLIAVPDGCLAFKGQSFNRVQYPILATKYPNLILPDLRAEFLRGWDNGRNIDRGRQILSAQGDAIRNITGHIDGRFHFATGGGAFYPDNYTSSIQDLNNNSSGNHKFVFDASRVVPTASENRPRNVAFQYICIAG